MKLTNGVVIAMTVLSLQVTADAQHNPEMGFMEIGASLGGAISPTSSPAAAIEYSLGTGANALNFQVSRISLGSYALGLGNAASYGGTTISGSKVTDFTLNYRRDLNKVTRRRLPIFYVGGGVGYFRSQFRDTQVGCPIICFPGEPETVSESNHVNTFGLGLQGGVRIPVWRGIGMQTGLDVWRVPAHTAMNPPDRAVVSTNADSLVRVTVGLVYRFNIASASSYR